MFKTKVDHSITCSWNNRVQTDNAKFILFSSQMQVNIQMQNSTEYCTYAKAALYLYDLKIQILHHFNWNYQIVTDFKVEISIIINTYI